MVLKDIVGILPTTPAPSVHIAASDFRAHPQGCPMEQAAICKRFVVVSYEQASWTTADEWPLAH